MCTVASLGGGAWLLEKCSAVSVQYLTTCVLLGALDYAACEHLFDLIHQQIVFFFTFLIVHNMLLQIQESAKVESLRGSGMPEDP
jgi:hypothetical protein